MTTLTKASSFMNIDNRLSLSDHITTNKEESINNKTSDAASITLQQISMKINLLLQNQSNLSAEVKDLRTKLEQQANKSVIPPPPPLPNISLTISEKPKNFSKNNNSANEPKNIDNKQTIQEEKLKEKLKEELKEELKEKLNKIRDKREQNYTINSNPKENKASLSEPEPTFKLRRAQSLYIKPKNNPKTPEKMDEKKISVADRIKQLQETSFKKKILINSFFRH